MSRFKRLSAGLVVFLAWSAVFALIYTQLPLYTSNQYQYYLHGLAHAGYGYLANDWLARTLDPTPLFSLLIETTFRAFRSEIPTYFYYGLLMGIYGISLWGIADWLFPMRSSKAHTLAFTTAFLLLHSTVFRFVLSRLWDGESAYLFEGGVAYQRVLGQFFQPSTFGVFLLLSIFLFLRRRRGMSIFSLAIAIYFHATYLVAGALITLGYLVSIWQEERRWGAVLRFGAASLASVLPVVCYALLVFGPTDAALYRQAQFLMVHYRLPQHANIVYWIRWTVYAQVALALGSLWVTRKTRLFPIVSVSALGIVLLTAAQVLSGSDSLALLFPWRLSVILIPLASTILLAAAVRWAFHRIPPVSPGAQRGFAIACLFTISTLMAAGVIRFVLDSLAAPDPVDASLAYLTKHASDEVVFIPPRIESFRLTTGMPAFTDLKSIPYRDTDVLEWYRRLQIANTFYEEGTDRCSQSQEIYRQEGVGLFLLPQGGISASCPAWHMEYQDSDYSLIRIFPSHN
jgi:hypothetical protein